MVCSERFRTLYVKNQLAHIRLAPDYAWLTFKLLYVLFRLVVDENEV